jgi:hypothetical protein
MYATCCRGECGRHMCRGPARRGATPCVPWGRRVLLAPFTGGRMVQRLLEQPALDHKPALARARCLRFSTARRLLVRAVWLHTESAGSVGAVRRPMRTAECVYPYAWCDAEEQ